MHTFKTMLPIEMIKLLFSFHPDIVLEEGTLNYDKKQRKIQNYGKIASHSVTE